MAIIWDLISDQLDRAQGTDLVARYLCMPSVGYFGQYLVILLKYGIGFNKRRIKGYYTHISFPFHHRVIRSRCHIQKAVKKTRQNTNRLQDKDKSETCLALLSYLSMQASLSSIHPSILLVFMLRSTSVRTRGQAWTWFHHHRRNVPRIPLWNDVRANASP